MNTFLKWVCSIATILLLSQSVNSATIITTTAGMSTSPMSDMNIINGNISSSTTVTNDPGWVYYGFSFQAIGGTFTPTTLTLTFSKNGNIIPSLTVGAVDYSYPIPNRYGALEYSIFYLDGSFDQGTIDLLLASENTYLYNTTRDFGGFQPGDQISVTARLDGLMNGVPFVSGTKASMEYIPEPSAALLALLGLSLVLRRTRK